MPKQSKKKTIPTTTLKAGTTTSSPVSVGDSQEESAATGSAALQTTTVPIVILPTNLRSPAKGAIAASRGAYPSGAQLAAVPGALLVLNGSTSFQETFGPLVPSVSHFAGDLANAAGWSTLRQALFACLLCVKSEEVYNWSVVKLELEQLGDVFQGAIANNPALAAEFSAIAKLLDVPKQAALRGASSRAAKAKANAAHTAAVAAPAPAPTPATGAEAAPVAVATVAPSGGGGVTH